MTSHLNRHVLDRKQLAKEVGGPKYLDFFHALYAQLRPKSYFEIGTQTGQSAQAFPCETVCVDPEFRVTTDIVGTRSRSHFFKMTSDDFFRTVDLRSIFPTGPDICFLDGMHRADYLLRDFTNVERWCRRDSIILLHDCVPANHRMALRTHQPGLPAEGKWADAWTGDVWKVAPVLAKFRPDLSIWLVDAAPTGLLVVQGLDPASTLLSDRYMDALAFMRSLTDFDGSELPPTIQILSARSLIAAPEDLTMFFRAF